LELVKAEYGFKGVEACVSNQLRSALEPMRSWSVANSRSIFLAFVATLSEPNTERHQSPPLNDLNHGKSALKKSRQAGARDSSSYQERNGLLQKLATGRGSDMSTSIRGYEPGEFSPVSKHACILDCKLIWNEGSNATRDDTVLNQMTATPQNSAPRLTSQTTSELWRMLMSHEYDKRQFGTWMYMKPCCLLSCERPGCGRSVHYSVAFTGFATQKRIERQQEGFQ
ncbi:hypothetical protein KCU61_g572, partial [Aureobasidium melanogenum]